MPQRDTCAYFKKGLVRSSKQEQQIQQPMYSPQEATPGAIAAVADGANSAQHAAAKSSHERQIPGFATFSTAATTAAKEEACQSCFAGV
jgi:hypothetical protein